MALAAGFAIGGAFHAKYTARDFADRILPCAGRQEPARRAKRKSYRASLSTCECCGFRDIDPLSPSSWCGYADDIRNLSSFSVDVGLAALSAVIAVCLEDWDCLVPRRGELQ